MKWDAEAAESAAPLRPPEPPSIAGPRDLRTALSPPHVPWSGLPRVGNVRCRVLWPCHGCKAYAQSHARWCTTRICWARKLTGTAGSAQRTAPSGSDRSSSFALPNPQGACGGVRLQDGVAPPGSSTCDRRRAPISCPPGRGLRCAPCNAPPGPNEPCYSKRNDRQAEAASASPSGPMVIMRQRRTSPCARAPSQGGLRYPVAPCCKSAASTCSPALLTTSSR